MVQTLILVLHLFFLFFRKYQPLSKIFKNLMRGRWRIKVSTDSCKSHLKIFTKIKSGCTLLVPPAVLYHRLALLSPSTYCEDNKPEKIPEKEPKFDWKCFWKLIYPHVFYLIIAVAVCKIQTIFWLFYYLPVLSLIFFSARFSEPFSRVGGRSKTNY